MCIRDRSGRVQATNGHPSPIGMVQEHRNELDKRKEMTYLNALADARLARENAETGFTRARINWNQANTDLDKNAADDKAQTVKNLAEKEMASYEAARKEAAQMVAHLNLRNLR
eukprot:TRINITY_DN4417_c0_g1_i1.p1 TRINITY_DN4417_c0_g1~~TRINITY_DN4417_c0_g1_i1.p1  ORF type:complete len:114 (-),score=38.93 TRINITY_DN4417_c0_g1_i1:150-491(-)